MKQGGQIKHGHATRKHKTPTYKVWEGIKKRCLSLNSEIYSRYGDVGIKMCKRWLRFENFLTDMGKRPEGMSIDRIDNKKGYCLKNCRWATAKEQASNRRSNHYLTYKGQTKTITEWSRIVKIPQPTLSRRIKSGWTIKGALEIRSDNWFKKNR